MLYKLITAMICVMLAVSGCGAKQGSADGSKAAQNKETASAEQSTEAISAGQSTETSSAGQSAATDSAEQNTENASAGQSAATEAEDPGIATSAQDAASELSVPEIEAGISTIDKYGNLVLTIGVESMEAVGYEAADIVLVRIGETETEMPVGTNFSDADSGEPLCCFKETSSGERKVVLTINSGNLAETLGIAQMHSTDDKAGYEWIYADGFDASMPVTISMLEKQGYEEEYRMHQISGTRSNERSDYADLTDEEFANFRAVTTTGMGENALFRSSSPVNPALGRSDVADNALYDYRVHTIMNMADSDEGMRGYADYSLTSYSKCDIIPLSCSMALFSEEFKQKMAQGFVFFTTHEGPYLIHCNEGKDRTGYAIAILECLMGANAEEVIEDYMLTYRNFYGIEPGTEQYKTVAETNIEANLQKAFGISSIRGEDVDLQACAEAYLQDIGMSPEEITALKEKLSASYSLE